MGREWITETPFLGNLSSHPHLPHTPTHSEVCVSRSGSFWIIYVLQNHMNRTNQEKGTLEPTEAQVLKSLFSTVAKYWGLNIQLATRKESKIAITKCTCDFKLSSATGNPTKSLLYSLPVYQQEHRLKHKPKAQTVLTRIKAGCAVSGPGSFTKSFFFFSSLFWIIHSSFKDKLVKS